MGRVVVNVLRGCIGKSLQPHKTCKLRRAFPPSVPLTRNFLKSYLKVIIFWNEKKGKEGKGRKTRTKRTLYPRCGNDASERDQQEGSPWRQRVTMHHLYELATPTSLNNTSAIIPKNSKVSPAETLQRDQREREREAFAGIVRQPAHDFCRSANDASRAAARAFRNAFLKSTMIYVPPGRRISRP